LQRTVIDLPTSPMHCCYTTLGNKSVYNDNLQHYQSKLHITA